MQHFFTCCIYQLLHIQFGSMTCTCTSIMFHACLTAVLPRTRKSTITDVSVPMSTGKQPSGNFGDYSILSPITDDGDESVKTSDSGFEDTQQWKSQDVTLKGKYFASMFMCTSYLKSKLIISQSEWVEAEFSI